MRLSTRDDEAEEASERLARELQERDYSEEAHERMDSGMTPEPGAAESLSRGGAAVPEVAEGAV